MSDPEIKRKKTFNVRLTRYELLHIRDLFAIMLPPDMKETLSQRLAQTQDRSLVEAQLWQKVVRACEEAELPLGDDAPDFVVTAASSPPVSVFEVAQNPSPQASTAPHPQGGSFFDDSEPDEDER